MAKKPMPAFLKKGMREGSKAEEAADKKMGVKPAKGGKPNPFAKKGAMPAFKKGGKVGC